MDLCKILPENSILQKKSYWLISGIMVQITYESGDIKLGFLVFLDKTLNEYNFFVYLKAWNNKFCFVFFWPLGLSKQKSIHCFLPVLPKQRSGSHFLCQSICMSIMGTKLLWIFFLASLEWNNIIFHLQLHNAELVWVIIFTSTNQPLTVRW